MSKDLDGGCLCGRVRFCISGPPLVVTHCHCSMCRRAAGAAFITWVTLRPEYFRWTAGEPAYFRSSAPVRRGFCPKCGTTLSFQRDDRPDEIDVTAATLDDPEVVRPQDHIYWGSRLSWAVPADGLPTLPRGHHDHGRPKS
jgi:hypothetical protein